MSVFDEVGGATGFSNPEYNDCIAISDDMSDVSRVSGYIISRMDDLDSMYDYINKKFDSDLWQGLAKDRCEDMHKVIGIYQEQIRMLLIELKNNIENLQIDAEDFVKNSTKVSSIKNM